MKKCENPEMLQFLGKLQTLCTEYGLTFQDGCVGVFHEATQELMGSIETTDTSSGKTVPFYLDIQKATKDYGECQLWQFVNNGFPKEKNKF